MSDGRMIAIDPGDVHIGVALYVGDKCKQALTYDGEHDRFYRNLVHWLTTRPILEVVCEDFRLYPWMLQQQGFSEMRTARCIGVIEYICGLAECPLIMQGADIKKPAEAIMLGRGVDWPSSGLDRHAKDAVLHGYFRRFGPPKVQPQAEGE